MRGVVRESAGWSVLRRYELIAGLADWWCLQAVVVENGRRALDFPLTHQIVSCQETKARQKKIEASKVDPDEWLFLKGPGNARGEHSQPCPGVDRPTPPVISGVSGKASGIIREAPRLGTIRVDGDGAVVEMVMKGWWWWWSSVEGTLSSFPLNVLCYNNAKVSLDWLFFFCGNEYVKAASAAASPITLFKATNLTETTTNKPTIQRVSRKDHCKPSQPSK